MGSLTIKIFPRSLLFFLFCYCMLSLRSIIFQVLAALGTKYFENLLPDIIRNCSHQRASVRDGYLTLFKVRLCAVTYLRL